ncbi:MAG: alpha-amylase family glycosyl hydrolase, partial [Candidatus Acidiferrales bacterium]
SGLDQHRRLGLALSVVLGLAWAHCACAAPKHFDLPAGDAGKMLNQFAAQAEMQLLFDFTQLSGRKTPALVGDYEPLDALKKLIEGLPVRYTLVNPHTLALTVTPDKGTAPRRWWQRLAPKPATAPSPADVLEQVLVVRYDKELIVTVDPERARFSAWYEVFPRSCAPEAGRHGTFRDVEGWLPYIASMGFDVLYFPPIHPIGITYRKGKNNAPTAEPDDVGSPWAIGSAEGGHKSIHPQLGTLDDFHHLVQKAKESGLAVALDIAFQCTPDHPYVREHPEWFRKRPDGSIQYAENPPKKYQDIYPLEFETDEWESLWQELKSVFEYWIGQGVGIFRVDNPHTKSFAFWEWVIREIKHAHPEVIFLAEAFTRPKIMYRLAKLGYSQSYTYFTWRTSKPELTEYFEGMEKAGIREFFRPNLWPNTPDILPEHLQIGGRPAFLSRLALAATLGANYGIYGPAYELCENAPRERGSEEYLNSEKYELKHRDLNAPWSLKSFIARVNQIRRDNPALQSDSNLRFHETDNPLLICYSKATGDLSNVIVSVVNLDPFHTQPGWVTLDLSSLGLSEDQTFQAHDLITDSRYVWQGPRNFVELDPQSCPAHILRLRKRIRTEEDFDYYL